MQDEINEKVVALSVKGAMQREQERRTIQAGISYIKYIEAVRERQYGIMPVYTPLFEKEGA